MMIKEEEKTHKLTKQSAINEVELATFGIRIANKAGAPKISKAEEARKEEEF